MNDVTIHPITNGYMISYIGTLGELVDMYFENKQEMFNFIDQIME